MNRQYKGWLLETWECVNRIPKREFTLDDIYAFIPELQGRHPHNQHIDAKLRQKLQVLRDKGELDFLDYNGTYQKKN